MNLNKYYKKKEGMVILPFPLSIYCFITGLITGRVVSYALLTHDINRIVDEIEDEMEDIDESKE